MKSTGKSILQTHFLGQYRDLSNIDNLAELKWIFNKTGGMPDIGTLKTKVLKALKKADGTPVDALGDLFDDSRIVEKLKKTFGESVNTPEDLLNKLEDTSVFKQIFEVVE